MTHVEISTLKPNTPISSQGLSRPRIYSTPWAHYDLDAALSILPGLHPVVLPYVVLMDAAFFADPQPEKVCVFANPHLRQAEALSASTSEPHATRSPTPPLGDKASASPTRSRFRSRSPPRAPSDTTIAPAPVSARRSEDGSRRPPSTQASQASRRPPIIAQSTVRPCTPLSHAQTCTPESPDPAPSEQPTTSLASRILPDLSQYTNPDPIPDRDTTTLEELAHLVRLSKYQERKRANTRIRLQRSLISAALSARLTRCGEIAHKNLVDCFRTDDKKNFASLYNAVHDVRKSCDELRRYTLLEPEMDSLNPSAFNSTEHLGATNNPVSDPGAPGSLSPFLSDISASAREVFLNFLTHIRTNPDFLAARLCSLSSSELTALTTFHQGLEPAFVSGLRSYRDQPSWRSRYV